MATSLTLLLHGYMATSLTLLLHGYKCTNPLGVHCVSFPLSNGVKGQTLLGCAGLLYINILFNKH